jgi:hypothetical protein
MQLALPFPLDLNSSKGIRQLADYLDPYTDPENFVDLEALVASDPGPAYSKRIELRCGKMVLRIQPDTGARHKLALSLRQNAPYARNWRKVKDFTPACYTPIHNYKGVKPRWDGGNDAEIRQDTLTREALRFYGTAEKAIATITEHLAIQGDYMEEPQVKRAKAGLAALERIVGKAEAKKSLALELKRQDNACADAPEFEGIAAKGTEVLVMTGRYTYIGTVASHKVDMKGGVTYKVDVSHHKKHGETFTFIRQKRKTLAASFSAAMIYHNTVFPKPEAPATHFIVEAINAA